MIWMNYLPGLMKFADKKLRQYLYKNIVFFDTINIGDQNESDIFRYRWRYATIL